MDTIIRVSAGQRLVYKLVRDINTEFDDAQCPGLQEECGQIPTSQKRKRICDNLTISSVPTSGDSISSDSNTTSTLFKYPQHSPELSTFKYEVNHVPPSPLRHWPRDFFVYEVDAGILQIKHGRDQNIPVQVMFNKYYGLNVPFVKSTFNDNRRWYSAVPQSIWKMFMAYGHSKRASWAHF